RTNKCIASDRRHRPELSGHCKRQGYDGDGSAGFPDDFTSKYAKPDPHARSDSGCDRLYPELTRRPLTRARGCALRPHRYREHEDRVRAHQPGPGFWQIEIHFGFAQTPNVPRELGRADIPGLNLDPGQMSFFVGRSNIKSTARPGMARWRERLYTG